MVFDPLPEQNAPSSARRKVIHELVQGRDLANQLHSLLSRSDQNDSVSAEDLVSKIMDSFTNTLFMLSTDNNSDQAAATAHGHGVGDNGDEIYDDDSRLQPSTSRIDHSLCLEGRKSEDSQESCRSTSVISSTTHLKDRRGSYKRRKTSHTMKRETSTLIDDGHAWRKYGQKVILNAKHPRNYFRCTHKFDQGCQATKQVQKIEDEPHQMYRTTYYGNHTCSSVSKLLAPELILDCASSPSHGSSVLLSFNNADHNNNNFVSKQLLTHPFFSSVKQEFNDNNNYQASSSDYNNNNIVSSDHHDGNNRLTTAIDHRAQAGLESDDHHNDIHGDDEIGMDIFDDVLKSFQFE
ncbi:probable WRKY transcription factor 70 [Humulus lupulus]|uniref:probable WRKY transcription factor 70 n=1 Tax=Humulus lupulus TaxID=3486 RepID=UPI002B412725|nr:probable WRKY transcription factor 70 [Humulus lupulus]